MLYIKIIGQYVGCIKRIIIFYQASASLILTTLEKEKELLRVFLKVSQMENYMLRRMNLSSFLMVRKYDLSNTHVFFITRETKIN